MNTLTRTQRRAAELTQHLVDIAEGLLVEGGAAAVTTEAVARRADVAVQTVYNRVGGKPALLMAVAERAMAENRRYVDEAYATPGSPEARAMRIFEAYARFALERPHQFRTLMNPPGEPEAVARVAAMAREQNAKLSDIIRDLAAQRSGWPAVDAEVAANALWAMMDGLLMLALRQDGMRPAHIRPAELLATAQALLGVAMQAR